MRRRRLGRTGLVVSEICMGTMTFGSMADEATSLRCLDMAWDAGVTFIDTAEVYPVPPEIDRKVAQLKLELPPPPKAMGVYKPVVVSGNIAYVSGHGPLKQDGSLITGRVGADLDLNSGKAAARQTGLAIRAVAAMMRARAG